MVHADYYDPALVRITMMMDTGSSGIETASCNGVIPGTSGIDAASGNGVIHVTGPIAVHRAITTIAVSAAKSGSKRPGRDVAGLSQNRTCELQNGSCHQRHRKSCSAYQFHETLLQTAPAGQWERNL